MVEKETIKPKEKERILRISTQPADNGFISTTEVDVGMTEDGRQLVNPRLNVHVNIDELCKFIREAYSR